MPQIVLASETDFAGWRTAARRLVLEGVAPEDVSWSVGTSDSLFEPDAVPSNAGPEAARFNVPRAFVEGAATAMLYRDPDRFGFLYKLLWRIRKEPGLMEVAVDPDVVKLEAMTKAVRRDLHKMKAYVRFREVTVPFENGARARPSQVERAMRDGDLVGVLDTWFIAWFEPSHYIVEAVASFFVRRFTGMKWSILTPDRSASWDGETLTLAPGALRSDAPDDDALEDLWRSYYASIFNPARLKLDTMQGHMPKKYWKNLPEAELIAPLAAAAHRRASEMVAAGPTPTHARAERVMRAAGHEGTTVDLLDDGAIPDLAGLDLEALEAKAKHCKACPLWEPATQTVFGEGPKRARLVIVGEQPGDHEDLAGKPFVGPAGQLLDRALGEAGVERKKLYVTNAVKHFKFVVRGKRRMHQSPKVTEIRACHPWVEAEIAQLAPDLVVAMGASAAQSLFGRATPVEKSRRQLFEQVIGGHRTRVMVTVHPSYLLRLPDEDAKAKAYADFVDDLRMAQDVIA